MKRSSVRAVVQFVILNAILIGLTAQSMAVAADWASRPMLDKALEGPLADVEEIIFAVRAPGHDGHWYANFGYWASNENNMMYGPGGGQLVRLNLRTGETSVLLNDPSGGIRDPQIHYDGDKVLFSYRKGGSKFYHLHEIDIDGTNLRQLTDGSYDDIEPTYLPDGDIMFCSSRCNRWVQCWHTHVAVLYRCDADGGNLRIISANVEQDNTPWVLPEGQVLYTRWEYIDRSRTRYHHLWTSNPDGTGQMVFYGNMHPGTVMIDAKAIPGTDKVVSIFSPGHGRKEHAGAVTIVDPDAGPDDRGRAVRISQGEEYRDPYALSANCFLVAVDSRLLLMDDEGRTEVIYSLGEEGGTYWCHEPRPLRARPRERIIPPRVDSASSTGHLILADITQGRNMVGVQQGEIKKLLVLESLAKPINHSGTMEPTSLGGTFTLPRVLGTVPVEPDGSAYMELPALRSLFFVALDEDNLSVKRMQSFVTVMPGETTSCVGCHEQRTNAPRSIDESRLLALRRAPSRVQPIRGVPEVFDFPRDIQPILDKHCTECHDYSERPAGDMPLVGAYGPWYSHSYYALLSRGQVIHGRDADGNRAPRSVGSSASPLMKLLDGSHYDAKLSDLERTKVRLWIESGAPYAGTYAALGSGMVSVKPPTEVLVGRCGRCHEFREDRRGFTVPFRRYQNELIYNLSDPVHSPILLAPLAESAGGWGLCDAATTKRDASRTGRQGKTALVAFATTDDPDYQKLLADIRGLSDSLMQMKRFDMPDFRPAQAYVREMKRFGILAESFDLVSDPIDVYDTDRRYWESLWYVPSE